MNKQVVFLLLAVALAGCKSGGFSHYSSPRVSGRVLAADTRQPLANVRIQRVVPGRSAESVVPPKGGQLMQQTPAVRTGADGRFVMDGERVLAFFSHSSWYSVTVSFEHPGYALLETNYTVANVSGYSSEGAPVVDAGDVPLTPRSK